MGRKRCLSLVSIGAYIWTNVEKWAAVGVNQNTNQSWKRNGLYLHKSSTKGLLAISITSLR